jgi:phosphatidylglycerol---prolipoprotein diacylglyceryl transferase
MIAAIEFPHIDPVLLRLGPLAIRWYGIAYLLGFLSAYALLRQFISRGKLHISRKRLDDLMGWLMIGVIGGGRAGWWLFYHRAEGVAEPWYEPMAIWHGGMSFHGGLIGVSIALVIWARWNRTAFWNVADCLALVTPIGLFFGRIANFINAELVGRLTAMPWGVIFPGESFPRHPSQIYEAVLEGPLLFLTLWLAHVRYRPSKGRIAALFLILYGIFRFGVEFTREPDAQLGFILFGWITMGQLLSAVLVAIGILLWLILGASRKIDSKDETTIVQSVRLPDGSLPPEPHPHTHIS